MSLLEEKLKNDFSTKYKLILWNQLFFYYEVIIYGVVVSMAKCDPAHVEGFGWTTFYIFSVTLQRKRCEQVGLSPCYFKIADVCAGQVLDL